MFLIAVGAEDDHHLGPGLFDPLSHGAAAATLGIVRMGGNDQDPPGRDGYKFHYSFRPFRR